MKKRTLEKVVEMEQKYFDLVAFARKRPEDYCHSGVVKLAETVKFLYPEELNGLHSEDSDWHHGFNSGMLAATRFFLEAEQGKLEYALDEFPFLDT